MGTNYYAVSKEPTTRGTIHIGKSSLGWKFLFHRVSTWENWMTEEAINTYPQWIKFLEDNKDRIVIMNEYDDMVTLEEFKSIVEIKQKETNKNNFEYADNIDGYRFTDREFS